MPQRDDEEKKPDLISKLMVGLAWLVLLSSATVFVLTTAQPEVVDGVARKILKR